jgi:hypothetical protein
LHQEYLIYCWWGVAGSGWQVTVTVTVTVSRVWDDRAGSSSTRNICHDARENCLVGSMGGWWAGDSR